MSNKSPWVKGLEIKPPYISLARLHGKIPGLLIWQRKGGYNFYSPLCNPVEAAVGLDEVDIIPDESLLESPARYSEDHGAIKSEILARFKQYLQVGDLDFTENLSHQLDAYAKTLAVLFFQWVIDNRYDWNRATKKAVAAWDNYAEYSIGELYSKFQSLPSNAETVEKKDKPFELMNFPGSKGSEISNYNDDEHIKQMLSPAVSVEERKHTDKEEYAKGLLEWIRDQDYVLSDYRAGKWYQLPFRETSHYYTALELLKEYDKYLNP
jgi:hypothetical protein